MRTFTFDNRNITSDYGYTLESLVIGAPVRRTTEVTIPFASGVIDMDQIMGYVTYDDRTITAKVWKKVNPADRMTEQNKLVQAFLSQTGRHKFIDSLDKESEYRAICTALDFGDTTRNYIKCTMTFKASPYRLINGSGVL